MNHSEPDSEDSDDKPQQELADPDDYHRRQRLKEIHKRRQQVSKTLDETDRYVKTKEHEKQKSHLIDAVTAYIAELEPLIERTDAEPEVPEAMPWDTVGEFADKLGTHQRDGRQEKAHYAHTLKVYRACNQYLAEVKPLITEDDTDEWEV
jgi:hypothetical protein